MKLAAKSKEYTLGDLPVMGVQENGVAAYLFEAKSYEAMQKRWQLLEGLARGEQAFTEGKVVSHSWAKKRMVRWLK